MSTEATERLARMLALVPWLSAHDGVTLSEAAERFGVSNEQLGDDLCVLMCSGLPGYGPEHLIDIQFMDDEGEFRADSRIHVLDPQTLEHPVRFTLQESVAMLFGLKQLATLPGSHDQVLIDETIALLEGIMTDQAAPSRALIVEAPTTDEVLSSINGALEGKTPLELDYLSASRDEVTSRIVHVTAISMVGGHTYVEAYCTRAAGMRQFRLDRVIAARVRPDLPGMDRERLGGSARTAHPDSTQNEGERELTVARVRLVGSARWLLDAYDLRPEGESGTNPATVDPPGAGEIVVAWPIWEPAWLIRLALEMGGDLQILEPQPWRDLVAEAARRALSVAQ